MNHDDSSSDKINEKKHESLKIFTEAERGIYLDDVIYTLKNQNWTLEEEPCLNQTLQVLQYLQNFTLWAVWQWDSIPSEPQGLLFGNRYHLGNFDQCLDTPWHATHPELRNQYCLADIILERSDKTHRNRHEETNDPYQSALDHIEHKSSFLRPLNYLTWGLCVPSSCQSHSVQRLLGILLAHSHLGAAGLRARIGVPEPCQSFDKPREFDGLFYSFMIFMSIFIAIVLTCTFIRHTQKDSNKKTIGNEILKVISLQYNSKDILKVSDNGISVLYGIRFLSICFITLDHQFGVANGGPISNGVQVDKSVISGAGLLILHNDLFVDTFFVLSGFLSATAMSKLEHMPNLFLLILRRYIRLIVAYAVVIFFVCAVYPYIGSGPLWNRVVAGETTQCRKNWWLNLLMLSNYVDTENICLVISWYIPCDFHFFVVTMLLYWLYKKLPKLGIACAVVISICAVLAPGLVNYYYNLPPIQLFTYDFLFNPRSQEQFHTTYIKSHTRYASYLVGFFSGLYYSYSIHSITTKRFFQRYSWLGACIGLVGINAIMLYGATYIWRNYELVTGSIYAAVERPLFATSVCLLLLSCSLGHVPLLKSFLSWYPWVPLSRLSYGLYLTHFLIISRNVFSTRGSQHVDIFFFFVQTLGVIAWGCVAALFILLIFELPVNNLLNLCLNWNMKRTQKNETVRTGDVSNSGNYNKSYIEENLPSPSSLVSKF
ncbi:nose resistant to fluoxetine protein 6-like [Battus philenor]|uniref:nose resistant to fluoxetine protein 6-like n=1 Tax=Battus philenor TaxID=42288 RepID=UPI0035CECD4A